LKKINTILITAISLTEITAQCSLFFRAGYETTATVLSYVVYNLACNQEVQQKLYEEAKSVINAKV
jgi:cytochrome P450